MKAVLKKIISIVLTLILVACIVPAKPVYAIYGPVQYIDGNGDPQTCEGYHVLDAPWWHHQIYGWNVVDGNVTFRDDRQSVDGEAHIIITDGSTLTIKKGLTVAPGATLYIYGQSGGTGKLILNDEKVSKCAGLGGENNSSCGTIIINGATVIAYGGSEAAGIGSGNEPSDGGAAGVIIINRGNVTAYGGKYGAGIGGGDLSDGGTITINGGKVYAKGGREAAGIGGGDGDGSSKYGNGGKITITGGDITADTFNYTDFANPSEQNEQCLGSGIGGGVEGGAGTIVISGGKVTATGQRGGAGIGSGPDAGGKPGGSITISGGTVYGYSQAPTGSDNFYGGGAGIGSGRNSPGVDITISGGNVTGIGSFKKYTDEVDSHPNLRTDGGAGIGSSQHSSGGSVTITGGTITAGTSSYNTPAIGKGYSGSAPVCTLDYPDCKVWDRYQVYEADDRETGAFAYHELSDVHIAPCDHEGGVDYLQAAETHTGTCRYCNTVIYENHVWEYTIDGNKHHTVCSVCGRDEGWSEHVYNQEGTKCVCGQQGVYIRYVANNGRNEDYYEFFVKGKYTERIPQYEDLFTIAPDGMRFTGWKQTGTGSVIQPGLYSMKLDNNLELTAQWKNSWSSLQMEMDEAEDGATIVLDDDYLATPTDVEYSIPSGKSITIDLNGHTIDRNLTEEEAKGSVFYINEGAALTITGNGVITGGFPETSSEAGGAFTVDGGTLTVKGGTMKDCTGNAGAVWLKNGAVFNFENGNITGTTGAGGTTVNVANGTFNMSRGYIINNTVFTGAVYVGENGSFNVSGSPRIEKNKDDTSAGHNVYLCQGKKINVTDELGRQAYMGVTAMDPPGENATRVLTSGLNETGTTEKFVSDDSAYIVRTSEDGEAVLAVNDGQNIPVTSIEIFDIGDMENAITELTLYSGDECTLLAVAYPKNATYRNILFGLDYGHDNPSNWNEIIDSEGALTGQIKALSPGTVYIAAYALDGSGVTGPLTINVIERIPAESVSLDKEILTLEEGGEDTLTATVSPAEATNRNVTWTSSNPAVAAVDENGKVTAVCGGSAVITVKTVDGGYTDTCTVTVTVKTVAVDSVSLDKDTLRLEVGGEDTLTATVSPAEATNKAVTWTSSDESVATVDENGKVTAIGAGDADITVTSVDGSKDAVCAVTVVIPVSSVALNKSEITLAIGTEEALATVLSPEDATNKTVTWASSDDTVAAVDENGKVTALSIGTVTITVTTEDGEKEDQCTVYVVESIVPATSIEISETQLSLEEGGSETLTATVYPVDATNQDVIWESSDPEVATVNKNGTVTAIQSGTVTITAVTEDGEVIASCEVTVTASGQQSDITYETISGEGNVWTKGSTETCDFRFKRSENDDETPQHLTGVKVDGNDIDPSAYTKESGSVIIKLKPEYLETLSVGNHTLTAEFDDGNDPTVSFKVAEEVPPHSPDTGAKGWLLSWTAVLCIVVIFWLLATKRKRQVK